MVKIFILHSPFKHLILLFDLLEASRSASKNLSGYLPDRQKLAGYLPDHQRFAGYRADHRKSPDSNVNLDLQKAGIDPAGRS